MKPSEQFADLKEGVEAMAEGQDKADLLALFCLADSLHCKVEGFMQMVEAVKAQGDELEQLLSWRKKWECFLSAPDNLRARLMSVK